MFARVAAFEGVNVNAMEERSKAALASGEMTLPEGCTRAMALVDRHRLGPCSSPSSTVGGDRSRRGALREDGRADPGGGSRPARLRPRSGRSRTSRRSHLDYSGVVSAPTLVVLGNSLLARDGSYRISRGCRRLVAEAERLAARGRRRRGGLQRLVAERRTFGGRADARALAGPDGRARHEETASTTARTPRAPCRSCSSAA